jgi:hypothetical protein
VGRCTRLPGEVRVKSKALLFFMLLLLLAACGTSGSGQVPVAELPDPAIYALKLSELPEVGMSWQQSYNLTTSNDGYKWSYLAYQAYQPGNLGVELESAFAVNNDVVLYDVDMSRADLPQPPQALGDIQNISWKSARLSHRIGEKSAVWKTSLGEMLTPIWWLEFYQGHAYVRISLLGFPDQIAPSILSGLGDIVVERLPRSVSTLRTDAATVIATLPAPSVIPMETPAIDSTPILPIPTASGFTSSLPVISYTAPPGETGMVSFSDESGNQLSDGVQGSDDILADLGKGTAYEWVGWTDQTEPVTLTFSIQEDAGIAAVQIGFNHRDGLGVFVPASVNINGTNFNIEADAVPNNQRSDLTFSGPFQAPTVQIILHHRGRGWILVDEVKFLANP